MSIAPPHPIIIKTSRAKTVLTAALCLFVAAISALHAKADDTPIPEALITGLATVCLTGFALYLLAIGFFRPIALRMDADGISGYHAPPVKWEDIDDIAVYVQETRRNPFDITYAAFRLTHSAVLLHAVPHHRYEHALRLRRRSGYHVLVPQMMLKDYDASTVVTYARAFHQARQAQDRPATG